MLLLLGLSTDGLAATLASPAIGVRALTTGRQATTVTVGTIAIDAENSLHVRADFTTKITFHRQIRRLDGLGQNRQLIVGQLSRAGVRINLGRSKDSPAQRKSDPIDIGKRVLDFLFVRDFNTNETGHKKEGSGWKMGLALALLVPGILAHHTHDTLAPNDTAGFTKRFDRWTYAHGEKANRVQPQNGERGAEVVP